MPATTGYDIGLKHAAVNAGVAVGFLLDENDPQAFVEERGFVTDVKTTTGGAVTVASYGQGAVRYRLRLLLRTSVMRRNSTGATESPTSLRTRLLEFAATNDAALTLERAEGDRVVAFVDDIKFLSGPSIDGYVALVRLVDIGPGA